MAKKRNTQEIPIDEIIEVQMIRKMKYGEYLKLIPTAKEKGWEVSAYQDGFRR